MKIKYPFLTVFALSFLTGCATNNISNSEAIPTTKIINNRLTQKDINKTEVVIKRDSGFTGSACSYQVLIDVYHVANLRSSEKVTVYLKDGDYVLTSTANGICGGGTASYEFKVNKKPKNYRISSGQDGTLVIQPSIN